jgi:hypothetical protein
MSNTSGEGEEVPAKSEEELASEPARPNSKKMLIVVHTVLS